MIWAVACASAVRSLPGCERWPRVLLVGGPGHRAAV